MNDYLNPTTLAPHRPHPLPTAVDGLQTEVLRLRDEVIGLRARLAESEVREKARAERETLSREIDPKDHIEHLQLVVADLEAQIAAIKNSSTWRAGRVLLSPVWLVRGRSRRAAPIAQGRGGS